MLLVDRQAKYLHNIKRDRQRNGHQYTCESVDRALNADYSLTKPNPSERVIVLHLQIVKWQYGKAAAHSLWIFFII